MYACFFMLLFVMQWCIAWYVNGNVDWNNFIASKTNPDNCPTNTTQVKLICNDYEIIKSGVRRSGQEKAVVILSNALDH